MYYSYNVHMLNNKFFLLKEQLIFHCGLRTFSASPIFSEHTVADKHKV